ncbi:unnamed protein product [Rangifer tarandus platyrhynchus]|uniref:Uncharacterized protein n=1 Tax=Rangifer tarandus platyrhynchus TaxID=3082113 RepID=A0ABN8Y9P7_RANTA|nr:unnamed protein product [Rangifer tarandus platyrhynchus]
MIQSGRENALGSQLPWHPFTPTHPGSHLLVHTHPSPLPHPTQLSREGGREGGLKGGPFGLRVSISRSLPSFFVVKPFLQQDAMNRCNVYTAPGEFPRPWAVWNRTSFRGKLFLHSVGSLRL